MNIKKWIRPPILTPFCTDPLSWGLFLGIAGLFIAFACWHLPYMSDDAFISLRYAKRLTQGLGLTWTDGEWVEGYTDLLWVLLNALTGGISGHFVGSARFWGMLGGVATILFAAFSPHSFRLDRIRLLTIGFLLSVTAPLAIWAIGGLEHTFLSGLLTAALYCLLRAVDSEHPQNRLLMASSLLFGLVCITRADAPLCFGAAGIGLAFRTGLKRSAWPTLLRFASLPILFMAGQLLFRIVYYEALVPNTAKAKVAFNLTRLNTGLDYMIKALPDFIVFIMLALLGMSFFAKKIGRHRLLIPLAVILFWVAYIIAVGGDHFYGRRQLVQILPPLALMVGDIFSYAKSYIKENRVMTAGAILLMAVMHLGMNYQDPFNHQVRTKVQWEWNGLSFGHLLRTAFAKEQPMIAMEAAGSLPFFSELPAFDMLGLTDKYLTENKPKNFGEGFMGHELGDGEYVLKRSPDIIVFNHASGDPQSAQVPGKQLMKMPEFHERYQFSMMRSVIGNRIVARVYIKKEDGPISIKRTPNQITIPAHLLTGEFAKNNPAVMDQKNKLFVPIDKKRIGIIPNIWLDKGTWALTADPPLPTLNKQVECYDQKAEQVASKEDVHSKSPVVTIQTKTKVSITIGPKKSDGHNRLYNAVLKRVDPSRATQICR